MHDDLMLDFIDEGWMHYRRVEQLIYETLYRDFGVPEDANWRQTGPGAQVVAWRGRTLAGTARLVGAKGDSALQLRQLAVSPEFRCQGVGRALVEELERDARAQGAQEVWLNARESAFPFYERLGYEYTGEMFVSELTQIPHRPMRKRL